MALENQPFFRAPSVPKLGRRNISSSIFSNVLKSQPQLKTSTFSFLKPIQKEQQGTLVTETLKKVVSGEDSKDKQIYSTLVETNRILVEIQKQLSLDFASRITEKKQSLGSLRASVLKKRAAQKEKAIESVNNDAGIIRGAFDKITAPAKGIFNRIIEFISTIATGFIVNAAFAWLSDEKNRQKLLEVVQFLTRHWKWLVGIVIGAKLIGAILRIVSLVRRIKGLVELIRRVWGKPPKPPGPGGGNPCAPLLQCMGNPAFSAAFVAASIGALIANQALSSHIRDVAQGLIPAVPTTSPLPGVPTPPPILGPAGIPIVFPSNSNEEVKTPTPSTSSLTTEQIWQIAKANLTDPIVATTLGVGVAAAMLDSPAPGPADLASVAVTSGGLLARFRALSSLGRLRGVPAGVRLSRGGTIPAISKVIKEEPKKKCDTCSLLPFFSMGGTVGGRGSGNVDSVPAILAPGEEVIRTSSANLFRPLLKDINDNAGTMWQNFTDAIEEQEKNNLKQAAVNYQFSRQIDSFNKELEVLINQEKRKKIEKLIEKKPKVSNIPPQEGTGRGGSSDILKGQEPSGQQIKIPKPFTGSLPPKQDEKVDKTPKSTPEGQEPPVVGPKPEPPPSGAPAAPAAPTPAAAPVGAPSPPPGPVPLEVKPYEGNKSKLDVSSSSPDNPLLPFIKSLEKSSGTTPFDVSKYVSNRPPTSRSLKSESGSKTTMVSMPMPPITLNQPSSSPRVSEASSPPTAQTTNGLDKYVALAALEYGILT